MPRQDVGDRLTRYAVNLRFRYRHAEGGPYHREGGWTRDLSSRGAWVELPERVAALRDLTLALKTPEGELAIGARVAWTYPGLRDAPFLHGLLFTNLTPERYQRLSVLFAREKPLVAVRLYCALAATCQRRGVGCPALPGSIRDLSDGGVCVRLPESMAPGTELCLRTATLFGQIAADARVVWADSSRELPRGASYRHGLQFLRLHPSSELPLRALLDGIR